MLGFHPLASAPIASGPLGALTPGPPVPRMAGPKVIAIDAAYGSDLVARFEKWGIINQINVGDNASLIFEAGREHLPTGPFVFHFTKPDGTGYSTNPGLSYDTQLMFGYATYGRFS